WFVFSRIRQDREAATDALVLAQTGESSRSEYGHTLLKILDQFQNRPSLAGMVGILDHKGPLEKRIQHIARFTGGAYRFSLAALLLLGLTSIFFLTRPHAEQSAAVAADPAE